MTQRGYLKPTPNAGELARAISRLEDAGVAPDNILIGGSVQTVIGTMQAGDILVICSLSCCGGLRDVVQLLASASRQGVSIRSLDEGVDTSLPPQDWVSAAEIFLRLEWSHRSERTRAGIGKTKADGYRRAKRPNATQLKKSLSNALVEYYQSHLSVRAICMEQSLGPNVLYRCMDLNGLPRRGDIAENPSLHPFAEGKALRIRIRGEWVKISPKNQDASDPVKTQE